MDFLQLIQEPYPEGTKLAVFWDNAIIQRANVVKEAADRLGIKLIFNMPYRTDFMGVEFYWSVAKNHYYRRLDHLKINQHEFNLGQLVFECLAHAQPGCAEHA